MGLPPQSGIAGRMLAGVIASVVGTLACSQAWAQSNSDVSPQTGSPTLKIDEAKRYFVRFGYVAMKPNTRSKEVKDVTGDLVTKSQLDAYADFLDNTPPPVPAGQGSLYWSNQAIQAHALSDALNNDQRSGLGIPSGITVEAKSAGTPAVSLGYFLDEDQNWAVEAFVLAVPLKNEVYGKQTVKALVSNQIVERAGTLDGKKLMTTQVLPPLAMVSRYFGSKDSKWRPSLGVGAAYAIFFDTKATGLTNTYAGGKTDIKLKNAFGLGVFGGLQYRIDDRWHLNATLGYLKLKTEGTMTTNETRFNRTNAVLYDLGGYTSSAIEFQNRTRPNSLNNILIDLADYNNGTLGSRSGNYGKFVRKLETALDPYIFWVSAGYSF